MFFHDCGAGKERKTLICSTSHKKISAPAGFSRGICTRLWKSCAKTCSISRRRSLFGHIIRTQRLNLSANCASASAVVPLFPACRCDSGANAARPTDRFRAPHPDGRPGQPTADALPHSFLQSLLAREAFSRGAEPPIARPRNEQPSSTTKGGERRATLFAFLRSYIIYTRARRGLFVRSAGGARCARRWKNGKAGRNAREGGHFLHTVEKTVENKLWISGKSARFFHRPATNGGEAVNGARAAGRPTAKAQREAPQSPSRGGESKH